MSEESIKVYFSGDKYNSLEDFKQSVFENFSTIMSELSAILHVTPNIKLEDFQPFFKTETIYKVAYQLSSKSINYVLVLNKPTFNISEKIFIGDLQLNSVTLNEQFELVNIDLRHFFSDIHAKPNRFELIKINHSVKNQDNDIRVQYGMDSTNIEKTTLNGSLKEAVTQAASLFQKVKNNFMEKTA